jgi:hypothetical protein
MNFDRTTPGATPKTIAGTVASHANAKPTDEYRSELVEILGIPRYLLRDKKQDMGLQMHYKRYKACLQALSTAESISSAGDWAIRKPSDTEIIELFIGKTMWHSHLKKLFSRVPKYPEMAQWLDEDEDALPDMEVWGEEKSTFVFKDLQRWLEDKEAVTRRKSKGRAMEYDKDEGRKRGKGKGKEKEMEDVITRKHDKRRKRKTE